MADWTEITLVEAPSVAYAGESIRIAVKVKNIHTSIVQVAPSGSYNGYGLYLGSSFYLDPGEEIIIYSDYFSMPDKDIIAVITALSLSGGQFGRSNILSIGISLTVPRIISEVFSAGLVIVALGMIMPAIMKNLK